MGRAERRLAKKAMNASKKYGRENKRPEFAEDYIKGYEANEEGILYRDSRITYGEVFYNDYFNKGIKEPYGPYLLFTLKVMYDVAEDTDPDMVKYINDTIDKFAVDIKTEDVEEVLVNTLNPETLKIQITESSTAELKEYAIIKRIMFLAPNIEPQSMYPNKFFGALALYFKDKKKFFELMISLGDIMTIVIDGLYDYFNRTNGNNKDLVALPTAIPNAFKNEEVTAFSNITHIFIAGTLKWYLLMHDGNKLLRNTETFFDLKELSAQIGSDPDITSNANDVLYVGRMRIFADELTKSCLGDDYVSKFYSTGDITYFEEQRKKKYKTLDIKSNYARIGNAEAYFSHHSSMVHSFLIQNIKEDEIPGDLIRIEQSLDPLFLFSESITTTVSLSSLGLAHKLHELRDESEQEIKELKETKTAAEKEAKKNRIENTNLKQKVDSLENRLAQMKEQAKSIPPKADLSKKAADYSAIISEKDAALKNMTDLYEEAIAKCEALESKVATLTKQLECVEETTNISMEDMIRKINEHSVLLVGGRYDLKDKLTELGMSNFVQIYDISTLQRAPKADNVVICTKFCSHSLVELAESLYKGSPLYYCNAVNAELTIKEIHEEMFC